jgi:DNA-binding CsgD family transcriptional regulator
MLKISSRTVEVHRAKLMRKLNMKGQTELIRYAIQRGLTLNQR